MAKIDPSATLVLLFRLLLAGVFLFAAFPKIQDPGAFATSIEGFRVIDGALALWIALVLPWLELVIGFGILVPQIRRASGLIIMVLLIAFIGLHASAWIRGLDINCGCFGLHEASTPPNYIWLIARNVGLLAACLYILFRESRNSEPRKMTEEHSTS